MHTYNPYITSRIMFHFFPERFPNPRVNFPSHDIYICLTPLTKQSQPPWTQNWGRIPIRSNDMSMGMSEKSC